MTQHILTLNNYLRNSIEGFVNFFKKAFKAIERSQTRKAIDLVQEHLMAQKVYRDTFNQLSNLTDRELADIGIKRGDIHTIAMDAFVKKNGVVT